MLWPWFLPCTAFTQRQVCRGSLMHSQSRKNPGSDGGFSLVEVLVAITVLGLSAAVILNGLTTVTSQSTKQDNRELGSLVLGAAAEAAHATEFDCGLSLQKNATLVDLPANVVLDSIEWMPSDSTKSWEACPFKDKTDPLFGKIQRITLKYKAPDTSISSSTSVINVADGFSGLIGNNQDVYFEAVPNQIVEVGSPKILDLQLLPTSSGGGWLFSCPGTVTKSLSVECSGAKVTLTARSASPATEVLVSATKNLDTVFATFAVTTICPPPGSATPCSASTSLPGYKGSQSGNKGGKDKKSYNQSHGFGKSFGKGYDR